MLLPYLSNCVRLGYATSNQLLRKEALYIAWFQPCQSPFVICSDVLLSLQIAVVGHM
jgi:hypothetical protein